MERELGLDRRETGYFYTTCDFCILTAIEVSTKETLRLDGWQMWQVDRLMLQSCRLFDYN